jgi:hypothetical protein
VLAISDIRSGIGTTENDYLSVLARKHETSLQSVSIALFSNAVHLWSWQRRSFFCVLRSSPHATIGLLLLSSTPTTISEMDKTTLCLTSARDDKGSFPWKSRTACRERPLAPTAHCPAPTDQTADMYQNRSDPVGVAGKSSSGMEASPLSCSTGDASQMASSGLSPLLEAQIKAKVDTSEGSSRDDRVDQGDGQEQSTLGS